MPTWRGSGAAPPPPLPAVVHSPPSYDSTMVTSRLLASAELHRTTTLLPSDDFRFQSKGAPHRVGSTWTAEEVLLSMRRGGSGCGSWRVGTFPPPSATADVATAPLFEGTAKVAGGDGGGGGGGPSSSAVVLEERSSVVEEPKKTTIAATKPRGKKKASESTPEEEDGAGGVGASKAAGVGRRKWKKPKGKPKRPLSAYNLFFQRERAKILLQTPSSKPSTADDPSKKKPRRRKHRRTHGKIGFADLAKIVAERWKLLDGASRAEFEALVALEKRRYEAELAVWNETRRRAAEEGEAESASTTDSSSAAPPPPPAPPALDTAATQKPQFIGLPPWNLPDAQARLAARRTYLALREGILGNIIQNGGTAEHLLAPSAMTRPSTMPSVRPV